jgi:hypothetical protein
MNLSVFSFSRRRAKQGHRNGPLKIFDIQSRLTCLSPAIQYFLFPFQNRRKDEERKDHELVQCRFERKESSHNMTDPKFIEEKEDTEVMQTSLIVFQSMFSIEPFMVTCSIFEKAEKAPDSSIRPSRDFRE